MSRCDSTPATTNSKYKHEHNMFIIGRETTNLHRKLVKVDPGCLGTAGSWGIPHRISGDPSPRLCTSGGTSILRYAVPDLRRDSGILVQRGYRGNPTGSTKLHILNFPSREKDGGFCPVISHKRLNHYVRTEHFKMEGLHLLPTLI